MFRTDRNHSPAAFTTDIAKEAGLIEGTDYEQGESFTVTLQTPSGAQQHTYYTAKLLSDPVALTIKVIDAIGFRTRYNAQRWTYISMPRFVWLNLTSDRKRDVVGWMYRNEGGTEMTGLFPNYELYTV